MILTPKQKWVVDRLKKEGWKVYRDDMPEEYYLYKNIEKYYSSEMFFVIDGFGCRIEFRPNGNPALHLKYYFRWPSKKNWGEINEVISYFRVVDNNIHGLLPVKYY